MPHRLLVCLIGWIALLCVGYITQLVGSGASHIASAQPTMELEAVLAKGATAAYEPVSPTTEFPEDAEKIYLALKSEHAKRMAIKATWMAVNVEDMESHRKLGESRLSLNPGQRGAIELKAPRGGFLPGDYQVELALPGGVEQSLAFKVVPVLPPAPLVDQAKPSRSFNIALAALGGRVEVATSEGGGAWAAANLLDGTARGWQPKERTFPQEIVLSFHQRREAVIAAVVIDTATPRTVIAGQQASLPKHVEVWTSTASATDGFSQVGGARLPPRAAEYLIALPPTRAQYVKLRFLSSYGAAVQAAEVKVFEAGEGASILADLPRNLALPGLGGAIVRYTSAGQDVGRLVDGSTDTSGWRSTDGYLPQDVLFAFRGNQVALIDRIVLNPNSKSEPGTWPRRFSVAVSTESPLDGFQEVGQFTLAQEPRDQEFPIGRRARFVKLRLLQNFGGKHTSLGEVQLIEGTAPDYESVLLTPVVADGARAAASSLEVEETGVAVEREPNNTPAEANALELGQRTKGMIEPLGEEDYFRLSVPEPTPAVLTLELLGRPYIRTSLSLLDAVGNSLKRFDPGKLPKEQVTFSWMLQAGEYVVRVTEPAIAMVLIWDTSGSMGNSIKDLQRAVETYLDQVRPSERLHLIRFSNDVEELLPEFTADRDRLQAASQGKFSAGGGTRLYDAVARGIELLDGVPGNRAIVVMTDGADTGSKLAYPGFWRLLEEKRIRLYTIGLGAELKEYMPRLGTSPERMMAYAALAMNGRSFFAHSSDELKGLYQQIADELRTISTYYLRPTLSRGPGSLSVVATGERLAAVSAPSQIELILDASGSMKRKLEGRPMIDIAKEAMTQIIEGLPDEIQVALRFYGHRIREKQRGDCQDSELVFPFAKIDKPRLLERVRTVQALGTTPIAYSLQQVERDFAGTPGEKMVILVTDGKEECKGNPAVVVADLLAKGIKIRLNIVGFALAEEAVKQEMQRIAELTGGRFFDAKDAKALRGAIEQALAVPYEALDAAGTKVAGGLTGQGAIELPEGIYTVVVGAAGAPVTIPEVRILHKESTTIELKKEGQEIGTRTVRAAP